MLLVIGSILILASLVIAQVAAVALKDQKKTGEKVAANVIVLLMGFLGALFFYGSGYESGIGVCDTAPLVGTVYQVRGLVANPAVKDRAALLVLTPAEEEVRAISVQLRAGLTPESAVPQWIRVGHDDAGYFAVPLDSKEAKPEK